MSYYVIVGADIERESKVSPESERLRRGLDLERILICEGLHRLKLIVFWDIEIQSRA